MKFVWGFLLSVATLCVGSAHGSYVVTLNKEITADELASLTAAFPVSTIVTTTSAMSLPSPPAAVATPVAVSNSILPAFVNGVYNPSRGMFAWSTTFADTMGNFIGGFFCFQDLQTADSLVLNEPDSNVGIDFPIDFVNSTTGTPTAKLAISIVRNSGSEISGDCLGIEAPHESYLYCGAGKWQTTGKSYCLASDASVATLSLRHGDVFAVQYNAPSPGVGFELMLRVGVGAAEKLLSLRDSP